MWKTKNRHETQRINQICFEEKEHVSHRKNEKNAKNMHGCACIYLLYAPSHRVLLTGLPGTHPTRSWAREFRSSRRTAPRRGRHRRRRLQRRGDKKAVDSDSIIYFSEVRSLDENISELKIIFARIFEFAHLWMFCFPD
jgi:hypothetical protein